jgi:hypothetical protein
MNIHGVELWIKDHQAHLLKEARELHQINAINDKTKAKKIRLNRYFKNFFLLKYVF